MTEAKAHGQTIEARHVGPCRSAHFHSANALRALAGRLPHRRRPATMRGPQGSQGSKRTPPVVPAAGTEVMIGRAIFPVRVLFIIVWRLVGTVTDLQSDGFQVSFDAFDVGLRWLLIGDFGDRDSDVG